MNFTDLRCDDGAVLILSGNIIDDTRGRKILHNGATSADSTKHEFDCNCEGILFPEGLAILINEHAAINIRINGNS